MKKIFLYTALGFIGMIPLSTYAYDDGIYTGLVDDNGTGVITVIFGGNNMFPGVNITLKAENQEGTYKWGNNISGDPTDYFESSNNNKWGGGGDTKENGWNPTPINYDERMGPCGEGYHVPSAGELNNLIIAWCNIFSGCNGRYSDETISGVAGDLIKNNGRTEINKSIYLNRGGLGKAFKKDFNINSDQYYFWSSSPYDRLSTYDSNIPKLAKAIYANDDGVTHQQIWRSQSRFVRCFKNSYVEPPQSTTCDAGKYLEAGATDCTQCPAGSYCPAGKIISCPAGYTSNVGAKAENECTPEAYTVTFNSMGGGEVSSQSVYSGQKIFYPQFPDKDGFMFNGWYTESEGGREWLFYQDIVTGNMELFARYLPFEELNRLLGDTNFIILDRNLGAISSGTGSNSYGNYYQWGNNYGFRNNNLPKYFKGSNGIGNSEPGNYYINQVFYGGNPSANTYYQRYSRFGYPSPLSTYQNLRGDVTNTDQARQGPCPIGYHVPSISEWANLFNGYKTWYSTQQGKTFCGSLGLQECFINLFKLPLAGTLGTDNTTIKYFNKGTVGTYSSSTSDLYIYGDGTYKYRSLYMYSSPAITSSYLNGSSSVRCFKNNQNFNKTFNVIYDSRGGTDIDSAEGLQLSKITAPSEPSRDRSEFVGWYKDPDLNYVWNFNSDVLIDNITLYAKWSCPEGGIDNGIECPQPKKTVTFDATTNGGNTVTEPSITRDEGTVVDLPTCNETKDGGYTCIGWNTDPTAHEGLTSVTLDTDKTVYAIFKKTVTVTFSEGNGVYSITQPSSTSCTAWNTATTCSVSAATATCNAGYRSPAWSESTNNLSGNITTTASCTVCDAGTYTEAGNTATSCTQCEAGYYCPAGSAKAQCTGRTEYSAVGVSECSAVNEGYYTTGCDGDGNKCTGQSQCTAGTACSEGVKTSCEASSDTVAGTYSSSNGATSCTTASDGYYVESANATTQTQCPAGSYCQGGMKNSCPTGYTSNTGATAQNQCYIEVSAGNYLGTANGTTTTSCAAGTYKGAHNVNYGSTSSCDDCTAGNYCPAGSPTQTACTTLGSNYTHSAANSTSASACYMDVAAGSYKTSENGNATTGCGAGKWSAAHTSYYGSADTCSNIEAGCYGSSATSACPAQCVASTDTIAGSYSSEGANACTPATDGNYVTTAKATTETLCPAGSYCPGGKIISCTTLGTDYTSDAGASAQNGCYKVLTATFQKNGASNISSGSVTCKLYNGSSTCNITSPTITSASGFEPLGFNTDNTAETSILAVNTLTGISTDIAYYAITKSTSPIKVTFDVNGNGGSTSTGECYRYNGSGSCSITAPTITSAAEFTVIGWNSNKDTHTNEWTGGDSRTVSADATYYAQSSKAGYQVTASYIIGTGVSGIGATSGKCNVDTIYNGSGYLPCNITLPDITLKPGYNAGVWSTGNNVLNPGSGVSLLSDDTYTASATPNDNTPYKVKHYFENVDGTGFDIDNTLTDDLTGTTDTHTGAEYKVVLGFTGSVTTSGAESSGNIAGNGSLILKLYYTRENYTLTFDSNGGSTVNPITAKYQSGIILPESTRTGYIFTGWKDENDVKFYSGDVYTLSGDTTLTGQWIAGTYVVTFDVNGGNALTPNTGSVTYDAAYGTLPTPSRGGYSFNGWFTAATNGTKITATTVVSATGDHTLYAQWTQNQPSGGSISGGGSGGGGGGGGGSTKTTTKTTTGTVTTGTVATGTNETNVKSDNKTNLEGNDNQNDGNKGASQKYSDEFQQAYEFASKNGITTMDTIEKANMDKPLTRIAMAKMLSYYAINVLGLKPDETRVNKFKDVSDKMDAEYNNAVTLAYQLGIMGINMPNNKFRPNDEVTRAEFATALSRMLYTIADGKDEYYSTHMAKLMEEKIITNDNPDLQELRGYVMIMLMRSAENKNTENN